MASTTRFGRNLALPATRYINADADEDDQPRPVRVGRDDSKMLRDLSQRLGIDDSGDYGRIERMTRFLKDAGIDDIEDLKARLQRRTQKTNRALSPLYSNIEIVDWLKVDSEVITIPSVAIGGTTDITIAQAPCRWYVTDFSADGVVAASGRKDLVEIRLVLGTTEIAKFRLSAMDKTSQQTMVLDSLNKVYSNEIGPNSTLKVRVVNTNSGVGQSFDGHFQYTRKPASMDASIETIMEELAL